MAHLIEIHDRSEFEAHARDNDVPVRVYRSSTVIPETSGGVVRMRAALRLRYAVEFEDPFWGESAWLYSETLPAKNKWGDVDLSRTLWKHLEDAKLPHVVMT